MQGVWKTVVGAGRVLVLEPQGPPAHSQPEPGTHMETSQLPGRAHRASQGSSPSPIFSALGFRLPCGEGLLLQSSLRRPGGVGLRSPDSCPTKDAHLQFPWDGTWADVRE